MLSNLTDGDSTISGFAGDERSSGHDYGETIDGGAGDDRVEGGMGNDTRTRSSATRAATSCGNYYCKIPFGNDVIDTRDGALDTIDCGAAVSPPGVAGPFASTHAPPPAPSR